jgi:hypothetical protein
LYLSTAISQGEGTITIGRGQLYLARSQTWSSIVPDRRLTTRHDPFEALRGNDGIMIRLQGSADFAAGIFHNVDENLSTRKINRIAMHSDFTRVFARTNFRIKDFEVGLTVTNTRGSGYRAGVDFSTLVADKWELFGEISGHSKSELPRPTTTGFNYNGHSNLSGLAGVQFIDGRRGLTVRAEYIRNGGGYSATELRALTAALAHTRQKLPSEIVRSKFIQTNYASFSIQKSWMLDTLSTGLSGTYSIDDKGWSLNTSVQSDLSDKLALPLVASRVFGKRGAEFSTFQPKTAIKLALRRFF